MKNNNLPIFRQNYDWLNTIEIYDSFKDSDGNMLPDDVIEDYKLDRWFMTYSIERTEDGYNMFDESYTYSYTCGHVEPYGINDYYELTLDEKVALHDDILQNFYFVAVTSNLTKN